MMIVKTKDATLKFPRFRQLARNDTEIIQWISETYAGLLQTILRCHAVNETRAFQFFKNRMIDETLRIYF